MKIIFCFTLMMLYLPSMAQVQRPANFYNFKMLVNKSHKMPNAVMQELQSTWWDLISDSTRNSDNTRFVTYYYKYNTKCKVVLIFSQDDFVITYETPYNTDEDFNFYNNAVSYLVSKDCKKITERTKDGIGDSFNKISPDINAWVMIFKFSNADGDVDFIRYHIINSEGI